ncbi:MAG: AAA family ATPase [candidate division Zixibacteria bacterium]|nr:AAA family ATPase [candidate division Zixibacteria bacterium]
MNRLEAALNEAGGSVTRGVTMVSILSGKGGVGKSVIAFNLAERAAVAGRKTLLVDADLCCGNIHILANVDPDNGLDAFALEQKNLTEAVCRYGENLDILARSDSGPLPALQDVTEVAKFARQLRRQAGGYDLVIIDQGSGISNTATLLASAADSNLIVMLPELTSISDSFGLCKFLYQANQEIECQILINRVESDQEANYLWTRFAAMSERFLGRVPSLAGSLPEDKVVRKAVATQQTIAEVSPESNVVQTLTGIVENLTGQHPAGGSRISIYDINSTTAPADIRE